MAMVRSAVKRNKRKSQREAARLQKQADAVLAMEEDEEIHFNRPETIPDTPRVSRNNTSDPEDEDRGEKDYTVVLEMVQAVRDKLAALILDNTNIRAACDDLRRQCHSQGVAFGDLSQLVKQSREDQEETRAYAQEETRPHPRIRPELIDGGGNLRAEDIGITWQDGDTFLHGVRIAGRREDMEDNRRRPATAAPYPPCPEELEDARRRPAMSTPYPQSRGHLSGDTSTPGFPHPVCIEMSDTPAHHFAGPRQEGRPAHRPAAPIQRFNNKTIGWPAWFRHFKAVADVHGWDKNQRALQMVSYLDEKAMNVAQELTDRELYDYDVLVKLLSDRFDPASRVLASRSRFHGRTRRHQEDADSYADAITELCRLGYPQSSPELRVMPFGLCNAPATFERLMDRVLQGLRWSRCLVYLDDIISFGRTFDGALSNLTLIFERLRSYGLQLKSSKCHLFRVSVPFLGHIVGRRGLECDPTKIEDVKLWPVPDCLKSVRQFLGFVGYYQRFIPRFADVATPLVYLNRQGCAVCMGLQLFNRFPRITRCLDRRPDSGFSNGDWTIHFGYRR